MSENIYTIGQIFEEKYPPDAAMWCMRNRAYIKEIEPVTREKEVWFETPAAYDDEGGEIPYSASSWKETIEEEVRRFQIVAIPEPTAEELAERELAKAKSERAAAVAAITVVVDGMTFDGDEAAQERMSRAVVLADSMDETTEWVLHDNTVAIVTADQLRRACKLAGKAQTRLWTVPYNQVEEVKDAQQAEVPTGSTGYFAS